MIDSSMTIAKELSGSEKLLWSGRPRQGVILRSSDALLIPFSLMWGGFAIFWEVSVLKSNAPFFFGIWGIPFVLVGLYLIIGRFFADAKQRERTWYGITDERVIIVSGFFSRNVKSLSLQTLTDVSLTEHSDHKGTITFGATLPFYSFLSGTSWPGMGNRMVPSFDTIDNAKSVYEVINSARKKRTRRCSRRIELSRSVQSTARAIPPRG